MPELDPDRRLALAYAPVAARAALEALWRLDVALGAILAGGRDAMAKQLRLAWWREALERLDSAPAPAEPMLQGLATHVLPVGVTGAELAGMEEGWAQLLAEAPLAAEALESYAEARGGLLFRLSARLLGRDDPAVVAAGARWALVDLARHSRDPREIEMALNAARGIAGADLRPSQLRPLGMLSILTRRDLAARSSTFEPQGSPRRILRMLGHRLTGH